MRSVEESDSNSLIYPKAPAFPSMAFSPGPAAPPSINDDQGASAFELFIGANPNTGDQTREWFGLIDGIAQWNRLPTDLEIAGIAGGGRSVFRLRGGAAFARGYGCTQRGRPRSVSIFPSNRH